MTAKKLKKRTSKTQPPVYDGLRNRLLRDLKRIGLECRADGEADIFKIGHTVLLIVEPSFNQLLVRFGTTKFGGSIFTFKPDGTCERSTKTLYKNWKIPERMIYSILVRILQSMEHQISSITRQAEIKKAVLKASS